jgi:hypothetical protein
MPRGLLVPLPDAGASPGPGATPAERLRIARGLARGDGWVELQVARANDRFEPSDPNARFLSIDAMTLLHDAFARASPGFDLFLPRRLDAAALSRLESELGAMKAQLLAAPNVVAAKARWGESSALIAALPDDVAWTVARAELVTTIEGLSQLAADLAKSGNGLWVVGM